MNYFLQLLDSMKVLFHCLIQYQAKMSLQFQNFFAMFLYKNLTFKLKFDLKLLDIKKSIEALI